MGDFRVRKRAIRVTFNSAAWNAQATGRMFDAKLTISLEASRRGNGAIQAAAAASGRSIGAAHGRTDNEQERLERSSEGATAAANPKKLNYEKRNNGRKT